MGIDEWMDGMDGWMDLLMKEFVRKLGCRGFLGRKYCFGCFSRIGALG